MGALDGITFGWAEAENEKEREPQLLLEGYYDIHGALTEVRDGKVFVILGRKGTGKTALWLKLELEQNVTSDLFVSSTTLGRDFPYVEFSDLAPKREKGSVRYVPTWKGILYLLLLKSLLRDSALASEPDLQRIRRGLENAGLLAETSLTKITRLVSQTEARLDVPAHWLNIGVSRGHQVEKAVRELDDVGVFLEEGLTSACPILSRHILFVDGLDQVYVTNQLSVNVLAALIIACQEVNRAFASAGANVKTAVVVRPDVLRRFPDADLNKVRQDDAVTLNWYEDTRDFQNTSLVKMVEQRVAIYRPDLARNFFTRVLPSSVLHRDALKFVLDHTCHRPRDIVQCMLRLQQFAGDELPLSENQVLSALNRYSEDYFLDEAVDELLGTLANKDDILQLLQQVLPKTVRLSRRREGLRFGEFVYDDFKSICLQDWRIKRLQPEQLLEGLFETGVVGNLVRIEDERPYAAFKFRDEHLSLDIEERLLIHQGMWKALNLV